METGANQLLRGSASGGIVSTDELVSNNVTNRDTSGLDGDEVERGLTMNGDVAASSTGIIYRQPNFKIIESIPAAEQSSRRVRVRGVGSREVGRWRQCCPKGRDHQFETQQGQPGGQPGEQGEERQGQGQGRPSGWRWWWDELSHEKRNDLLDDPWKTIRKRMRKPQGSGPTSVIGHPLAALL